MEIEELNQEERQYLTDKTFDLDKIKDEYNEEYQLRRALKELKLMGRLASYLYIQGNQHKLDEILGDIVVQKEYIFQLEEKLKRILPLYTYFGCCAWGRKFARFLEKYK